MASLPANQKYFNPDYLSADPYLNDSIPPIHKDYPNEISDDEFKELCAELQRSILSFLIPEDQRAFLTPAIVADFITRRPPSVYLNGREVGFQADDHVRRELDGTISKGDLLLLLDEVQGVWNRIHMGDNPGLNNDKKTARKRFKRIIDINVKTAQGERDAAQGERDAARGERDDLALAEARVAEIKGHIRAAQTLAQIYGCADGVMARLDQFENDLFNVSSSAESEVSALFSDYTHSFCQKFADLSLDKEWKVTAPQFAKVSTGLSLPHTGEKRTTFYSFTEAVRFEADTIFDPANLMNLFLKGGEATYRDKTYDEVFRAPKITRRTVRFDPFNAEKAIDLLQQAYHRGINKEKSGKILSATALGDFIKRDEYLDRKYDEFNEYLANVDFRDEEDGAPLDSNLFENIPGKGITFKRGFFEYILERLGYLVSPAGPMPEPEAPLWPEAHEAPRVDPAPAVAAPVAAPRVIPAPAVVAPVAAPRVDPAPAVVAPVAAPRVIPAPAVVAPVAAPRVIPVPAVVAPVAAPRVDPAPAVVAPVAAPRVIPAPAVAAPVAAPRVIPAPAVVAPVAAPRVIPAPAVVAPVAAPRVIPAPAVVAPVAAPRVIPAPAVAAPVAAPRVIPAPAAAPRVIPAPVAAPRVIPAPIGVAPVIAPRPAPARVIAAPVAVVAAPVATYTPPAVAASTKKAHGKKVRVKKARVKKVRVKKVRVKKVRVKKVRVKKVRVKKVRVRKVRTKKVRARKTRTQRSSRRRK